MRYWGPGSAPSPVPKSEGPGAPSLWLETVTETGATRQAGLLNSKKLADELVEKYTQRDDLSTENRGFAAQMEDRIRRLRRRRLQLDYQRRMMANLRAILVKEIEEDDPKEGDSENPLK